MLTFSINKTMYDKDDMINKLSDTVQNNLTGTQAYWLSEYILKSIDGDKDYSCLGAFATTANKHKEKEEYRSKNVPIITDEELKVGYEGVLYDDFHEDYDVVDTVLDMIEKREGTLKRWKIAYDFATLHDIPLDFIVQGIINFGRYWYAVQLAQIDLKKVNFYYPQGYNDYFDECYKKYDVIKYYNDCCKCSPYKFYVWSTKLNFMFENHKGFMNLLLDIVADEFVWNEIFDAPLYLDYTDKFTIKELEEMKSAYDMKHKNGDDAYGKY